MWHICKTPLLFFFTGSGTTEETSESITTSITEHQQTMAAVEYTPSAISASVVTQSPLLVSQSTTMQTKSITSMISDEETPQLEVSPQEDPLQQQDDTGKQPLFSKT